MCLFWTTPPNLERHILTIIYTLEVLHAYKLDAFDLQIISEESRKTAIQNQSYQVICEPH